MTDNKTETKNRSQSSRGRAVLAVAAGLVVLCAAVLAAVLATRSGGRAGGQSQSASQALDNAANRNPDVDPGTSLPGPVAPGFALIDQSGTPVALRQFRGKVVVLAFVDSRCTTVCPLSTVSMTEAVSMLGPGASRHIQLLGVNANPDATRVADVRAYTVAHQMTRSWDFLTGSRGQLAAVWRAYHVYVAASHGNIDHEPAVYLIDAQGRERTLYLTQMAYASVAQQAELIASGVSRLLPSHPALHGGVPMTLARSIRPDTAASLAVIGGARGTGRVTLGPGHPHLVVFLASWDQEISNLPADLRALADYQREALRRGWPTVVAVDETPTEASPADLARVLASSGGAALGYPVVADTSGRLADGYGVQDLPWTELISPSGQIRYHHDGWLSEAALARLAG